MSPICTYNISYLSRKGETLLANCNIYFKYICKTLSCFCSWILIFYLTTAKDDNTQKTEEVHIQMLEPQQTRLSKRIVLVDDTNSACLPGTDTFKNLYDVLDAIHFKHSN